MTYEIQSLLLLLNTQKKQIKIQWIPSHKNIKGNEIADKAAKKAHEIRDPITMTQNSTNTIREIKMKKQENWKDSLKEILKQKNYLIKDHNPQPWTRSQNRKIDVTIARLMTKHTRLKKHLHKLKIEADPMCRWCSNQEETPEHLILQCPRFNSYRTKLIQALNKIEIQNPDLNLLITGANQHPVKKYYILRHTKIFLQRSRIIDII
nr:uncharacterized protein LOC113823381 [Penaeus vannamei]